MSARRVGPQVAGTVFDIQRFSVHDGPGIRTTVFLKGCALGCRWCHNPQGISPRPQLAYRPSRCYGCGECVGLCPRDALSLCGGVVEVAWDRCDHCGRCVAVCAAGALEMAGWEASAPEVIEVVVRDEPFYRVSGGGPSPALGGMTLGGGEPLAQVDFTLSLLALAGERGIHRAVDTSGYAPWDDLEEVARACDLVLYDLKMMNPERHREFTGVDNELILGNARRLVALGVPMRLRVPIVPGLTDDEDNLRSIARFARECGGLPVDLLPYHRLTESAYRAVGMPYALSGLGPPPREKMARLRAIVERGE